MKRPKIQIASALFLSVTLAFAVIGATPQGKGQKGGKGIPGKQLPTTPNEPPDSNVPNVSKAPKGSKAPPTVSKVPVSKKLPNGSKVPNTIPSGGGGTRQNCVHSCNTSHKNDKEFCKGRTGQDRAACQREINEEHRLCIQSCPK